MLSMAQVSGEEQKLIPPDENDENDDDGMMQIMTAGDCNWDKIVSSLRNFTSRTVKKQVSILI